MKLRELMVPLVTLFVMMMVVGDTCADISNAAVLYLRIAPGARAAGMGEAYVAIADDATATHWNPAGLGAYPLAFSWIEREVPKEFRPLTAVTALKLRGGNDYMAYELWAIGPKGLVRYDNKDWYMHETFTTRTDQTVEKIIASYFNITDDERLAEMHEKVALANNKRSYSYLEDLQARVLAAVSEDYSAREPLEMMSDSLLAAFSLCRVSWDKVREIEDQLEHGLKDSVLSEIEADRVSIAVEKARLRFIPEELLVPYSVNYRGTPTSIASTGKHLLVGTERGLLTYNGKRWQTLTIDHGLPSDSILCLYADHDEIYVGTARGLARFKDGRLAPTAGVEQLPPGRVTAIGANGARNVWAALDKDLYHFDGSHWSNCVDYQMVLDDTPESIAKRFAVYGTGPELEMYLEKYAAANRATAGRGVKPDSSAQAEHGLGPMPDDIRAAVAEAAAALDSTSDSAVVEEETAVAEIGPETAEAESEVAWEPGMIVKAPFLASIKGKVNTIYAGPEGQVWIGTDYGVLYFSGNTWTLPGYRDYQLKEGETFEDMVGAKRHGDSTEAARYAALLRDINDIDEESPAVGQTVRIYRNPAAAQINRICRSGEQLYFATSAGLIVYDGYRWARSTVRGMDRVHVVDARAVDDEFWLASDEKIVLRANALRQLTLMHVNWLPGLALEDDLYYEFFGFVASSENWGTFGGNVTFITYGVFTEMGESGPEDVRGTFDAFDIALTGSYGAALTPALKVGLSVKVLYSKLFPQGVGMERGKGTSTGFAVDFGLLYHITPRLNWGLAVTNLGPRMAYIDAAQADDLPRNLATGFAYELLRSDFYTVLVTAEVNKMLVGMDDGIGEELQQMVMNGGAEFAYGDIIALRAGYMHDEEGEVKTVTLGAGLSLMNRFKFDFSYIPSDKAEALRNTLRISMTVVP